MPAGIIRRGSVRRYPFRFSIPRDALPTHHGHICSIRWTMHAIVDAPDVPSIEAHREILVGAAAPAVRPNPEGYQSVASSQASQLVLSLPRAVYAEGERLSGRVHVSVSGRCDVAEIRALLLRIESIPRGPDHSVYVVGWDPTSESFRGQRRPGGKGTTYIWLEGEVKLSGPLTLEPPQSATFPFTIDIPAQQRPSFSTEEGRVMWKVGAIVSCSGRPDIRAFHEAIIHTGVSKISQILAPEAKDSHVP